MKLEAQERIALMDLLAQAHGDLEAMHTLRRVGGLVGFAPDEIAKGKNGETIEAKEIWLDEWTKEYISKQLQTLDKQGQLTFAFLPLCDKFMFVDFSERLEKQDDQTATWLRERRQGKKAVALVGLSPRSCGMAPFDDEHIEIWGENEAHAFSFFKRADRWFQVHNTYWQRTAKRGIRGHFDWLKKNEWDIPIYMPRRQPEILRSVEYPLLDVCNKLIGSIHRGTSGIKYFNSSFDYMLALALFEGYDHIEIYGFDMAGDNEYALQKPSAEFWIGVASQHAEIILPSNCLLLKSELYGGKEQGEAWT